MKNMLLVLVNPLTGKCFGEEFACSIDMNALTGNLPRRGKISIGKRTPTDTFVCRTFTGINHINHTKITVRTITN
jgi:hypothetical protein